MTYTFKTSGNDAGRRLDRILRTRWPQVPLGRIMGALRKGEVLLGGKSAEPSDHPEEGQEISVPWEAPRAKEPGTGRADLSFVLEGKSVWVLDKPAGLLVQPAGSGDDSLIGRVWNRFPGSSDGFRPSAVNRLDRNTSGLVTVALAGPALRALQEAWRARQVKKTYLAIVLGEAPSSGRIDAPIRKDPAKNRVETAPDGEPALTHFVKVIGDHELSLLRVELVTGLSHQARFHLAHRGFPILGDPKYGRFGPNRFWAQRGVHRPLLHAWMIEFPDLPICLEEISGRNLICPPPKDMQEVLRGKGWLEYAMGV
ncbi:MAG: RluA family pseudouridine synthase [Synergistales bacterium]